MEGRAHEIHGLCARSIRSVASALPFRTARASAPNTLDTLLSPTIQSCTTSDRTKRVLREFRCNFTYAESGRVARHPFLWNFSFVPINFSKQSEYALSSSRQSNRIESNRDQCLFPPRLIIRIHDLFRVVLFSPLFQPQVSSSTIKFDGGSNKKRAKVCLERVSKGGRSLSAISPWREFLTRGRWQQATGSRKNIHSAGQIIRWLVKRPLSFTD